MAVNPLGERSRDQIDPPATAMSISAWPSITPTRPLSACRRATSTSLGRSSARNATASSTIISGPPTTSARVNCQRTSTARMMPSSMTRLVEANWNAIALVKLAPLRKIERASATAAYEQGDEAAPRPLARQSERGESSGSSRLISALETTACTAPDSAKPRTSAHRISQHMANARPSAWPAAPSTVPMAAHLPPTWSPYAPAGLQPLTPAATRDATRVVCLPRRARAHGGRPGPGRPTGVDLTITARRAPDDEHLQRLQDVLAGHLGRFGRRDRLKVTWQRL